MYKVGNDEWMGSENHLPNKLYTKEIPIKINVSEWMRLKSIRSQEKIKF